MTKTRKNSKSLIKKYVKLTMMITLLGLIIFGSILFFTAKEYFDNEAHSNLYKTANRAVEKTQQYLEISPSGYYVPNIKLEDNYFLLTNPENSLIFLTDQKGNIIMSTNKFNPDIKIPEEYLNIAYQGEYFGYNTLGSLYQINHHTVALPVYSPNNNIIGYVFASSSGEQLNNFLTSVIKVFIIGAISVLAFSFVAGSLATDKLLAPLAKISEVTKSFAKGDFTKRVPIYGEGYDEISQLSIAFNNMASSLAAHEQTRRSFVANVSHELKTPMTTIGGFIDGILDGTIPPDKHKQYMKIVSEEVRRLSRLVVSMLNISRIEAGEMELKPTEMDMSQIVLQTVFAFEQRIEKKNLDVRGLDSGKQMVKADPDMIHQVVYNLVDNAVKFANEDGFLEFSYKHSDGILYVGVKNSGAGIAKEEIQQVFERFYKTDKSRSLDKNGVGLGLYIARSIVNMHGGDIIVNSIEGEYCEFVFTIPNSKKI